MLRDVCSVEVHSGKAAPLCREFTASLKGMVVLMSITRAGGGS